MKYFTSAILLLIAAFIGASVDAIVSGKFFDRIVVVVFENTGYTTALAQPYLQDLTNRTTGLLLTSFYAITHPSQ
ncbi:14087_t:CDS:1, partial [Racocetra persica]